MKQTTLALWLAERGLTRYQFAREVGMAHHTINALCGERGARWGEPKLSTLRLISQVTGIAVETLAREAVGDAAQ